MCSAQGPNYNVVNPPNPKTENTRKIHCTSNPDESGKHHHWTHYTDKMPHSNATHWSTAGPP